MDLTIKRGTGGAVLNHFLGAVCSERLGEEVRCSMADSLRGKSLAGRRIKFGGVNEGLDQIAKLVGGVLTQNGEDYEIKAR